MLPVFESKINSTNFVWLIKVLDFWIPCKGRVLPRLILQFKLNINFRDWIKHLCLHKNWFVCKCQLYFCWISNIFAPLVTSIALLQKILLIERNSTGKIFTALVPSIPIIIPKMLELWWKLNNGFWNLSWVSLLHFCWHCRWQMGQWPISVTLRSFLRNPPVVPILSFVNVMIIQWPSSLTLRRLARNVPCYSNCSHSVSLDEVLLHEKYTETGMIVFFSCPGSSLPDPGQWVSEWVSQWVPL